MTPATAARRGDESVNPGWILSALVFTLLACAYIAFVKTVNILPGELVVKGDQVVKEFDKETILDAHVWAWIVMPVAVALAAFPLITGGNTRSVVSSGAALVAIAIVTGFWFELGSVAFGLAALLLLLGAAVIELAPVRQNMEARLQGL